MTQNISVKSTCHIFHVSVRISGNDLSWLRRVGAENTHLSVVVIVIGHSDYDCLDMTASLHSNHPETHFAHTALQVIH